MTEKNSPHITAARNQAKLNNTAKERFHVVNGKVEKYTHAPKDIEAAVAAAIAEEKRLAPVAGDLVPGKGIFFGTCTLVDKENQSLSRTFNMYAAPEDLSDENGNTVFTYIDAVNRIVALKNWHGHNGTNFRDNSEILLALEKGSYDGGWFIPTRNLLKGTDNGGVPVKTGTLYAHHDEGDFKGTFQDGKSMGTVRPDLYWSSTRHDVYSTQIFATRLSDNICAFYNAKTMSLSCRPIRLEPKP